MLARCRRSRITRIADIAAADRAARERDARCERVAIGDADELADDVLPSSPSSLLAALEEEEEPPRPARRAKNPVGPPPGLVFP